MGVERIFDGRDYFDNGVIPDVGRRLSSVAGERTGISPLPARVRWD
jgi:hypothetical protein